MVKLKSDYPIHPAKHPWPYSKRIMLCCYWVSLLWRYYNTVCIMTWCVIHFIWLGNLEMDEERKTIRTTQVVPGTRVELTNLSRNVFSRSAPMHPANPRMNITPPTTMKSHTGSKPPRSVMEEMFDSTPCGPDTSDRIAEFIAWPENPLPPAKPSHLFGQISTGIRSFPSLAPCMRG